MAGQTNTVFDLTIVDDAIPDGDQSVTLTASATGDLGTNATIVVRDHTTPYQTWQMQYFHCTDCPSAAESADPDGDGQNNLAEFLAGTDPTNSVSVLRITSFSRESNNIRVTWTMGAGRTNALQVTSGTGGSYTTNNFADHFIVTNTVGSTTNFLDVGAATNASTRFYRVRLVP